LGRVLSANRNEAEKALRRSIELYESTEQVVETAVTYGVLGDLLRKHGEETGGCEAYRMGITLLEQST
jgi:lipopolysaccharide biosynthesis regulator YciM